MKKALTKSLLASGKILREVYYNETAIKNIGLRQFTTTASIQSENKIIDILQYKYPEHNILTQEGGLISNNSDYTWIIDPLNGIVNFVSENPLFAVSISLKYKDEIILSGINLPIFKELFIAQIDKGATLNGRKITVSSKQKLNSCIVSLSPGIRTKEKIESMNKIINNVMNKTQSIVIYGSTSLALAFVACGRTDCYVTYKSSIFNLAAGLLVVKEAGGKVSDFGGAKFCVNCRSCNIIASNKIIHSQIFARIKKTKLK